MHSSFPITRLPHCVLTGLLLASTLAGTGCGGSGGSGAQGNAGSSGTAGNAGNTGNGGGGNGTAGNGGATSDAGTANAGTANAGTANAGAAGAGAGIGGDPTDGQIGARCQEAADCRPELTCIPSTGDIAGFGGPPRGWCTLPCASDDECLALSEIGLCIPVDDGGTATDPSDDMGYCSELCLLGTPLGPEENKCHQRVEMACAGLDQAVGVCIPTCSSDADCEGRFCDLSAGFCVDAAPAGEAIGAACAPGAEECQGFCAQSDAVDVTQGFCSGACTLGLLGCGEDPTSIEPVSALCMPGDALSFGAGDLGICFQGCDCNDECSSADNLCLPLGNTALEQFYGRVGACAPPFEPQPGGNVGDAGTDAGGVAPDPFVTGIPCQ